MNENQQINVAIVEDDPKKSESLKRHLEYIGCTVIVIVRNMTEVLEELIPLFEELVIHFIFLDNSLEKNNDGKEIAERIRGSNANVKLVGFSSTDQDYVDIPLGKTYLGLDPLREAVGINT